MLLAACSSEDPTHDCATQPTNPESNWEGHDWEPVCIDKCENELEIASYCSEDDKFRCFTECTEAYYEGCPQAYGAKYGEQFCDNGVCIPGEDWTFDFICNNGVQSSLYNRCEP